MSVSRSCERAHVLRSIARCVPHTITIHHPLRAVRLLLPSLSDLQMTDDAHTFPRKVLIPVIRSSATLRTWLRARNFFDGSEGKLLASSRFDLESVTCGAARRTGRETT